MGRSAGPLWGDGVLMTDNNRRVCERCRFFDNGGELEFEGYCRRNPPLAAPEGHAFWPLVDAIDWCGEFESGEN